LTNPVFWGASGSNGSENVRVSKKNKYLKNSV
jgi:hypothetical protein